MKTLGITGGIGSGKSYVSHILSSQYGIPVYDCDTEAKRLNEESGSIRQALQQLVGPDVYDAQGHLRKANLAQYLFQGPEYQQAVNAIIHPVVRQDFHQWSQRQDSPIVAFESAILLESGFSDLADAILTVTAPIELRIQRAVRRDGTTAELVERRIRLQTTDELRIARSHFVIHNDGRPLEPQIEELLSQLLAIEKGKLKKERQAIGT